jgi:hypothetical protein
MTPEVANSQLFMSTFSPNNFDALPAFWIRECGFEAQGNYLCVLVVREN